MGKPGSGIMEGNTKWLGSFDECYAVTPNVNISGIITTPFTGHYCRAKFNLGAAQKVRLV